MKKASEALPQLISAAGTVAASLNLLPTPAQLLCRQRSGHGRLRPHPSAGHRHDEGPRRVRALLQHLHGPGARRDARGAAGALAGTRYAWWITPSVATPRTATPAPANPLCLLRCPQADSSQWMSANPPYNACCVVHWVGCRLMPPDAVAPLAACCHCTVCMSLPPADCRRPHSAGSAGWPGLRRPLQVRGIKHLRQHIWAALVSAAAKTFLKIDWC